MNFKARMGLMMAIVLIGCTHAEPQSETITLTASTEQCAKLPDSLTAAQLREIYSQPSACWPAPNVDESVTDWQELTKLPTPVYPEHNPYSQAKEQLGKILFFDPRLSDSQQIACVSCHDSQLGWADGLKLAVGHNRQYGNRNTPTILNSSALAHVFWDGRADSLEMQAIMSMTNPIEMNAHLPTVVSRLQTVKGYQPLFEQAWGSSEITEQRIAASIATYVRSINSRTAAFDMFLAGQKQRMNDEEIQGLHVFRTKAGCMNCHHGALLTDGKFHNIGFHFYGRELEDLGRYAVTGEAKDVGAFRTSGLRDVSYTGPWLHNGWATELMPLLRFYNIGGPRPKPRADKIDDPLFPETSHLLKPLHLSEQEMQQLVAFMGSISARPRLAVQRELPQ